MTTVVTFYIDGVMFGRSTHRVPTTPMHLVMQFETTLQGFVPAENVEGNVHVDWLKVWALGR